MLPDFNEEFVITDWLLALCVTCFRISQHKIYVRGEIKLSSTEFSEGENDQADGVTADAAYGFTMSLCDLIVCARERYRDGMICYG